MAITKSFLAIGNILQRYRMKELEPGILHTYNKEQLKELKNTYGAPSPPPDDINLEWMRVGEDREVAIGSAGLASLLLDSGIPRHEYQQVLHRDSSAKVIKEILKKRLTLALKTESAEILDSLTDFLYEEATQKGWLDGFEARALNAFLSNEEKILADAKTKIVINPQIENGVVRCTVTVSGIGRVKTGNLNIKPSMEAATYESVFSVVYDKEKKCYTSTQESFSHAFFNDPQSEPVIQITASALKEALLSEGLDSTSVLSKDKKEILEKTLNFLASHETPINEELMDLVEKLAKNIEHLDNNTKTFLIGVKRKIFGAVVTLDSTVNSRLENIRNRKNTLLSSEQAKPIEVAKTKIEQILQKMNAIEDMKNLSEDKANEILTNEIERISGNFNVAKTILLPKCRELTIPDNINPKLKDPLKTKIREANAFLIAAGDPAKLSSITSKKNSLVAVENFLNTLKEMQDLLKQISKEPKRLGNDETSKEINKFLDTVAKAEDSFNQHLHVPKQKSDVERAKVFAEALVDISNARDELDKVDHEKLSSYDHLLRDKISLAKMLLKTASTVTQLENANAHLTSVLTTIENTPVIDLVAALAGAPSTEIKTSPTRESFTLLNEQILKSSILKTLKQNGHEVSEKDIQFLSTTKNWEMLLSQKNRPIVTYIVKECMGRLNLAEADKLKNISQVCLNFFQEPASEEEAKELLNLSDETLLDLSRSFNEETILLEDAKGNCTPCKTYLDYWKFTQNLSAELRDYFANNFHQNSFRDKGFYYSSSIQKDIYCLLSPLSKNKSQCVLKSNEDGSAKITLIAKNNFNPEAMKIVSSESELSVGHSKKDTAAKIEFEKEIYKIYKSAIEAEDCPIETTTMVLDVKAGSGKAYVSVTGFGHEIHNQSIYQLSLKFASDKAMEKILAEGSLDENDKLAIRQACLPYIYLENGKIRPRTPVPENITGNALFFMKYEDVKYTSMSRRDIANGLRRNKTAPLQARLDLCENEKQKLDIVTSALKDRRGRAKLLSALRDEKSPHHNFLANNTAALAYPGLWRSLRHPFKTRQSRDVLNRLSTEVLIHLLEKAQKDNNTPQMIRLQNVARNRLHRTVPKEQNEASDQNENLEETYKKTMSALNAIQQKKASTPSPYHFPRGGPQIKQQPNNTNTSKAVNAKKTSPDATNKENVLPTQNAAPVSKSQTSYSFPRWGKSP